MKLYGQAEYIWHLMEQFIENNLSAMTAAQKDLLRQKCREAVFQKYSSVRELEVGG